MEELMLIFAATMPKGNIVPRFKTAKRLMSDRSMRPGWSCSRSLHSFLATVLYDACPNDCVLFEGDETVCPHCSAARFDSLGRAVKVFRYMPIIPQLARLYASKHSAEWMRWAGQHKQSEDGRVSDITESAGFREFVINSSFFDDIRNVVLTLCTDGINPWETGTSSVWPLLLTVLNLPPDVRSRSECLILVGLIPGHPKHLNAYLKLIVDELLDFGLEGVRVYDAASNETFLMRFRLLLSIADYPGAAKVLCQKGSGAHAGCMKCSIAGSTWYANCWVCSPTLVQCAR